MLQVNENLNNPPAPGSARAGGGSGTGLPGGLPAGFRQLNHFRTSHSPHPPCPVAIWNLLAFPDFQFSNNKSWAPFPLSFASLILMFSHVLGLDFNNLGDSELQNLLNNMSQQQLMQVLILNKILSDNVSHFCFTSAVWRLSGRWQCLWSCQPAGWSGGA